MNRGVAVVTGASGGIGAACADVLAREGFSLVLGARRVDALEAVASEIEGDVRVARLDVTDTDSVTAFCELVDNCRVLVNNAGGAFGMDSILDASEERWIAMFQTNVLGSLRMTKGLLDKLVASGDGQVVSIGSIAAFEPYPGGGGYNAAKHAQKALFDVLRLEQNGKPIRVTQIDPGLVETNFSVVRFDGDKERAANVYRGLTPLTARDIAECVAFAVTRPSHVDIDQIVIRPRDQARVHLVHRES